MGAYIPAGDVIPPFRAALGSIGPGVAQLQHALIAVGAMSPDVISYRAGFFGPGTTKAIREYKAEQGIESHPYQYGTYDEAVYDSLIDKIDALVNDSDGSADDVQESKQQKPKRTRKPLMAMTIPTMLLLMQLKPPQYASTRTLLQRIQKACRPLQQIVTT